MGHWIWIAARGKVVRRDENGRAQRIIGTCQDISARKALEEKEQRVTRAFQLLSQCSSILVRANDENQLLDSVCHLCTEVGGYRMAWVGFAIHDEERSVHPAAWAGQESGYLESARISWGDGVRGQGPTGTAMRTGATVAIQNMPMAPSMAPWRAAASQRGYQSCIALPLRVGEATVGVLSLYSSEALSFGKDEVELLEQLAHDLSYGIQALRLRGRRDAAESELRDARERLETALEASGFSIWEFDATTGLVTHDERWATLMGLPPGKVAIPAREFWRIVHPDDLPAVRAATVDAFKGKTARYVQEWRARSAAGEWRWIRSVGRIVELSLDGRALRSIGTNVDITEQKTHELELARARKEAEAANLAKSQFLATMSHEIRTPMNGILGMAELLQTPGLAAEDREDYLRVIIGSGHSLLSLLNDILDLSKIEAGRVELETIPFDAEETLGDVAMLFGKRASEKGLAIEVRWNGARGAAYRSDPVRLRQMISNLVSNAIKFTNHGIIRIEGRQVEGSPDQAILEFSVQDTGIGIPKEFQAQLFQPFTQADATMTRKFGGSGLGLSIVRSLAQRMGGDSWLESEVGLGTKVWLRIRSGVAHGAVAAPVDAPATAVPPATHEPNPQYGNARILIVEDNPTNRKVVEGLLRREGLAFESVDDGEKALARVTSGEPTDLVLMDCQMPVMDGWEATRRIRQWERDSGQTLRLPIVALTAGAFETDRQQCRLAGMDDFLAKPLSVRELRAALAKWLAVREQVAGS
jgi:PAS domain S-box-containing protein